MQEQNEFLLERYELAMERIRQIKEEDYGDEQWSLYFKNMAAFIEKIDAYYQFVRDGGLLGKDTDRMQAWNQCLYENILPQHYETDYINPTYAAARLGEKAGPFFAAVSAEMRGMIRPATKQHLEEVLIRIELFVEIYSCCIFEWQENGTRPAYESLRQILYWYVSDYTELTQEEQIEALLVPKKNPAVQIISEADPDNSAYLYRYGEYVSPKAIETAAHLAALSGESIRLMAEAYLECALRERKNLLQKKRVQINYALGYERVIQKVLELLRDKNLVPVISRPLEGILEASSLPGNIPDCICNEQYDLDHRNDIALVWDRAMVQRKAEVCRTILEKYREGKQELQRERQNKEEALFLNAEQEKLLAEYLSKENTLWEAFMAE